MHPPCRSSGLWFAGTVLVALIVAVVPAAAAQDARGTIVGRVTDARSGGPLAQVSVTVEGARLGTTTGSDGQYRISGVSAGNHTVAARRIGYAVVRKPVTVVSGGAATVEFSLEQAAVSLDQIVVTGTAGGQLRRTLGNAVATVDAGDQLAKSAATNLSSLLNARAPGLSVQPTTGRLGAGPAIQIRGRNSLSLANSPLIYID